MEEPPPPREGAEVTTGPPSTSANNIKVPLTTEEPPLTPATGNAPSPTPPKTPQSMLTAEEKENLEERYIKLRTIAVKLKKRINEQNEEISDLEKEKAKFQNASKIQLEFDKAQDEVERLRKEKKILEKDIQKAVDENVRLKVQTSEDTAKLQSLTTSHKVLREKVDKLEKDCAELEQFREKALSLEKDLKEAKDNEASAEHEKRQSAILSLEITDYEKKLQDANRHLEEKKAEVEALRKDLTKRSEIIDEHEKTLLMNKDKEEVLTRAKESLQADVQRKLEKISFLQDEMNKLKDKLSDKNLEYIKLEQEYENAKLQFSSQSKELVEKCDGLQRMISTLEHKVSVLEENKRSRESHIANLKLELQQLESEYQNYKTKAQTMLKSQKPIVEEQQTDELENLQKMIQNFQSDISILRTDLQTLRLENDNLLMEKSELGLRLNQLKTDGLEKEIRLNNELQRVKEDLRQKDDLHRVEVEDIKNANAQRTSEFELKLETLKQKYEGHIHKLQEQLDNIHFSSMTPTEDSINNGPVANNKLELSSGSATHRSSAFRPILPDGGPSLLPEGDIDHDVVFDGHTHAHPLTIDTSNLSFEQLRMLPRGEGEGSESVSSAFTPRPSVDNYLSFEQLLSSSLDSSDKHGLDTDFAKRNSDAGINLKEELVRSKNQIGHLTALLRESESNCERLAQLSEALKEEIRRVERKKERKEHLKENTEYLKNVLLKFMTLHGDDERRRLIPVMKTMLQLTTEEVSRLENSIKGRDSNTHVHSGSGPVTGWSSYLPLWGGGGAGEK